ncbi:putative fatty acid beta hydroxylase (cytochrome P450) [Cereibacter sphaeroides WS8N]|uniref:cytochrome P450 n=1 Tax=Cereibacter sphaeroides TaxID=1063 RepID=UPI00020DF8F8|nr:cytochrome P450 [Cereibacter sphaeroides]EGJ20835.1 putative fatty acid beta hydroxylase (cytochrome P450) [Cereibacter sphaeroides WS8N]
MTTDEGRRPEEPGTPASLREMPRDPRIDASMALMSEGYRFVSNLCDRMDSDAVTTRLRLREVVCLRGSAAARLLYGAEGLTRVGAMPSTVLHLLQDKGSVQQLEGPAHRHRKALFLSICMDPARVEALVSEMRLAWRERLPAWEAEGRIVLQQEAARLLTRAACRWAGVAHQPEAQLADEIFDMIDKAGSIGPRNWLAQMRRAGTEKRLRKLVEEVRAGEVVPEAATALHAIAFHREEDGTLLDPSVAAVELLNLLRPIVAVGRYITFAALALHREATWRELFRSGNLELAGDFAEEVRRASPFFPFTAAVTTQPITWEGYDFPEGQWLLLDLYGTTHDPRHFPEPTRFRAERMLSWAGQDEAFIPQGAGDVARTHRCPGEMITVELMKEAIRLLCCEMDYEVPAQDLGVRLNRMPAQPRSGMILSAISRRAGTEASRDG